MKFPEEYPELAVTTLIQKATGTEVPTKDVVLATYCVTGYILGKLYPTAELLMISSNMVSGAWGGKLREIIEGLRKEDLEELMTNLPTYIEMGQKAMEMKAAGMATWLIVIKLIVQYGPKAVAFLRRILKL